MVQAYIDQNGNKHLLSGMVTGELPKYTMVEYTALTNKPLYWECTDYDATSEYGINDTEVKHDNTTVNAVLNNTFKTFDDWTLLSDFDTNNDTWIATYDGFLSVRATNVGATNGTYCYLYDTGLSSNVPISTIALPSGGGSLTYAQVIPVIKGHTYKMLMGGAITSVASYFLKINK